MTDINLVNHIGSPIEGKKNIVTSSQERDYERDRKLSYENVEYVMEEWLM